MGNLISNIVSLAKRRGFIFPSSEIYGGFGSCYDFGPLGVEMKNNIKKAWWDEMTRQTFSSKNLGGQIEEQRNIVGLDAAILMSPKVWQASGHLTAGFADELVECKKCHKRFRQDEIVGGRPPNIFGRGRTSAPVACPECKGELSRPRKFNLMMKTFVGPVEDEASQTYLRAETCQGIYLNFKNVLQTMRLKIPFGIAQIGKAFRNEITPGNFIFRTREFEQMEMQWFCHPTSADDWFEFWLKERLNWYYNLGIKKENLRAVEVPEKERAHYAKRQVDIEYKFPLGWKEIEGVHNRGEWDLYNHAKYSGEDLKYSSAGSGQAYYPYIIETSVGVDRSLFAFLCQAYTEVRGGRTETTKAVKEVEILLKLDKRIAPVKVAVLPLVKNKPDIVNKAKEVYQLLKPHFVCQYDELGSIGRRYRRGDEIGVVFSVTCDFQTLKDNTVTVRNRDTMKQERVVISDIVGNIGHTFL
ncbi:MAG: glycine--tRNA ligase [Candidatus Nealsonbacteria bacterium]|nr:glycine--tRNA ligase [Candidatus Nealsonbacteria bacterium]